MELSSSSQDVVSEGSTLETEGLDSFRVERNQTANQVINLDSGEPANAPNLQQLLEVNQNYQEILKIQLKKIEQAKKRNEELQKKVRLLISQGSKSKVTAKKPLFFDGYQAPPDNPDALDRNEKMKKTPIYFKRKKWTKNEVKNLLRGIRELNQERMINELMQQFEQDGSENLREFNKELVTIRNMTSEELLQNIDDLDWSRLSRVYVPTRSPAECRVRFFGNDDPNIKKSSWTKEEDKQLLILAEEHHGYDWVEIADQLGTGRTPMQCFRRYQRSLNTNMVRSKWTKQEDEQLAQAVLQFGEKNWQAVANCLEGRTGQQCLHRWQKTLNPKIRRGRWTKEEDTMLSVAVRAYGYNWVQIQRHVPGRTDVQCRERWVNVLNPDLNSGPWTAEEDNKLINAVNEYGIGKWAQIANILYPRTDNQCWRRWKHLKTNEVEGYQQIIYKKRKGLVSNFVGREKERPSLTPEDFDIEGPFSPSSKKKKKTIGTDIQEEKPKITVKSEEDEELEEALHLRVNFPENLTGDISFPVVMPSSLSFQAYGRLLECFQNFVPSEDPEIKEGLRSLQNNPQFQILSNWFYSLFLYQQLLWHNSQKESQNETEKEEEPLIVQICK